MFIKYVMFSIIMVLSVRSFAEDRMQYFDHKNDGVFKEGRKGMSSIQVNRDIWFDIEINLSTGILEGQWREGPASGIKIFDVKTPDHLVKAEVLIAKPYFDESREQVLGHYFVLFLTYVSRPLSDGGGYCGRGIEEEIVVIRTDVNGDISYEERFLVFSCMNNVIFVFIRDDDPHDEIYVIYDVYEDHNDNSRDNNEVIKHILLIDYLHPREDVVHYIANKVIGED